MARARNIKPGVIRNEDLADLDPIYRLGFVYSWMLCDVNGIIEYRPKRLKLDVFPYDDVDLEAWLTALYSKGFITLFTHSGRRYIKVVTWQIHQSPHKQEREAGSNLPNLGDAGTIEIKGLDGLRNYFGSNSEALAMIDDCGMMNDERGLMIADTVPAEPAAATKTKPTNSSPEPTANDFAPPTPNPAYHPALKAIRKLCGHNPDSILWAEMIEALGPEPDIPKLTTAYREWIKRGFKAKNFSWVTDWYVNGVPPPKTGIQQNGKRQNDNKPTAMDRIRDHAELVGQYPTEAEVAQAGNG